MTAPDAVAMLVAAGALMAALALVSFLRRERVGRRRWRRLVSREDGAVSARQRSWARMSIRSLVVRAWRHRLAARWGPVATGVLCAGLGQAAAGTVAALVLGAYGVAGFVVVRGRAVRRSVTRGQRMAVDAVVSLAADLRAGIPVDQALRAGDEALRSAASIVLPGRQDGRDAIAPLARCIASAVAVSKASGAPLADVLERLDTHLRAEDRSRALADAHAAGARASAALLAAMPAAGLGLGLAIGVDPLRVLLHTGLGAIGLCIAVALQLSGLAWTARLARVEVMV
jgi:tight adherence protein B